MLPSRERVAELDLDRRLVELRTVFAELAGGEPDGIWAASGRVNIIGEHTDYNDGLVLPIAIDRQSLAAVRRREDDSIRCWSRQDTDGAWETYPRGVARALADAGLPVGGFDLVIDSDVPSGGGLSSSAALECSVALALAGEQFDRPTLARICQRAENFYVGAPTGIMDQMAALLGVAGHALLLDCRDLTTENVPFPLDGLTLLVIDTKAVHEHSASGYGDRRKACEQAARALGVDSLRDAARDAVEALDEPLRRRARHVVTEIARVRSAVTLLREGRTRDLGPLLDASHASLREDFEVSVDELDVAVDEARAAGALGARMTGGGFGGSAIALAEQDAVDAVREAVTRAYAARDWTAPDIFAVTPADAASRLDEGDA